MRYAIMLTTAVAVGALFAIHETVSASAQTKGSPGEKIDQAIPDKAPAVPKQKRKILIFSKTAGFRHGSIGVGIKAISTMGEKTGAYLAFATEDESFFEPEKLKNFDGVFMLNTTGDCLKPKTGTEDEKKQREEALKTSLKNFISGGKGLIGVHSACDTYHNWPDYNMMMGGTFVAHPWNAMDKVTIKNVEPKNPINAAFDGQGFEIIDEIYVFRAGTAMPTDRKFLLTLDETKMSVAKGKRADGLYPISWISTFGKGRTFYCSLGHNDHIYWNPAVLRHYLAGIQYALGDLDADATPTAKK